MTKEKFTQVLTEEANTLDGKVSEFVNNGTIMYPENWETYRDGVIVFIKEVDKAYEVFQMENTKK